MPTSLRSASSFVVVPPPPAVVSRGGDGRAIGRGRRRAPRRHSGDEVVAPMTPSSSLRPSMLFGVGGGGGADVATGTAAVTSADGDASEAARRRPPIRSAVPSHLAETLDLAPLLERVASYARTGRGARAIIDLVAPPPSPPSASFSKGAGGRRRRDRFYDDARWRRLVDDDEDGGGTPVVSVATSAEMANSEYDLVREAMELLLRSSGRRSLSTPASDAPSPSSSTVSAAAFSEIDTPLPPMFDLFDGETGVVDGDDDDEWLDACLGCSNMDVHEVIDLRAVLQADQVVKLLLDTREWAEEDGIRWYAPGLAGVARRIAERDDDDDDDDGGRKEDGDDSREEGGQGLVDLHRTLGAAVEIVSAGPNLMDPYNRLSYEFRLASGNGRFPELDALRKREERLTTRGGDDGRELAVVRNEISMLEDLIKRRLVLAMVRAARDVRRGMDALGRLDAIFARASYGLDWGGNIPHIGTEGRFRVTGFVHPVLSLRRDVDVGGGGGGGVRAVTPVDLLIPGRREGGYGALIISGPNGGGKTLALKSFGLAAIMAKLGIPISTTETEIAGGDERRPVVDYFDEVLVEVGDSQSVRRQESTLMARLNSFSSLIQRMTNTTTESRLILLDELGGGTDPVAGSALAQSVLEKLISIGPDCRIVATTHSPQLKALSANDRRFESASVLMNNEKCPTFRLCYCTSGESFALEAARRTRPSLPDDVIDRAAELMNGGDDDGVAANGLRRYLTALEQEQRNARELAKETEATYREVLEYKDDMISKIQVSRMQLSRLESRLGGIFEALKRGKGGDAYELVGDSLEELRLLKKKLLTEEEVLSEKGLRRVPESYSFYEGETIVIIAKDSEFKGYDAVVKGVDVDDPLMVTVVPVLDLFSFNEDDAQEPLALRRRDVAIFDYPKWGVSSDDKFVEGGAYSDRKKSCNNLMSVLSTLTTTSERKITTSTSGKTPFVSARQRKSSAAAEKKIKPKKRK